MGRLTTKNRDFWDVEHAQLKDGIPSKWTHRQRIDPLEQALLKLARLEDLIEKYNVESMEDLELRLEDIEHYAYNCNVEQIDEIIKLKQENQSLNDRWEKLKEFIQKDHDWNLEQDNNDCALAERWGLEEMQKLEEEE